MMENQNNSTGEQPLGLQRQCFLYLVTHLEQFSPDSLALLPQKIRKELLLTLPAADIFQLETTDVVSGIKMNAIWKTLCRKLALFPLHGAVTRPVHTPVLPSEERFLSRMWCALEKPYCSMWREYLTIVICSLLLSILLEGRSVLASGDEFFVVHRRLHGYLFSDGNRASCPVLLYGRNVRLHRFERLMTLSQSSGVDIMYFLVEKCRLCPRALYLSWNNWNLKSFSIPPSSATFTKLLSTVSQLQVNVTGPCRSNDRTYCVTPAPILLENIWHSTEVCLNSLRIHVDESEAFLTADSDFRHQTVSHSPTGQLLEDVLKEIIAPLVSLPNSARFQELNELCFSTTIANAYALKLIIGVMLNHQHFRSLNLLKRRWFMLKDIVIHANINLLNMTGADLSQPSLEMLIQAFLSPPVRPEDCIHQPQLEKYFAIEAQNLHSSRNPHEYASSDDQFVFLANTVPSIDPNCKRVCISVKTLSKYTTSEASLLESLELPQNLMTATAFNPNELNIFDCNQLFQTVFSLPQLPRLTVSMSMCCRYEHLMALHTAWEEGSGRKRLQKLTLNVGLPEDVTSHLESLDHVLKPVASEVQLISQTNAKGRP